MTCNVGITSAILHPVIFCLDVGKGAGNTHMMSAVRLRSKLSLSEELADALTSLLITFVTGCRTVVLVVFSLMFGIFLSCQWHLLLVTVVELMFRLFIWSICHDMLFIEAIITVA